MALPEVQSVPRELLCYRCGLNSITAAPGTTPRTRFLCRVCCRSTPAPDPPEIEAAIHAVIVQVHKKAPELKAPEEAEGAGLDDWTMQPPEDEAQTLFAMLGRNGDSVESLRALILVPPGIEARLLAYTHRHPEDAIGIERVLSYRRRVGEEFERLVGWGGEEVSCTEEIISSTMTYV